MREAQVVLAGGHSIEDSELKYGLSVTGVVHPDRVLVKGNLRPGDHLILTKPLGTGIINTAIKGGLASEGIIETVTRQMAALNRDAARVMDDYPVHACTDITGFGLLGHLAEMVVGSGLGVRVQSARVPLLPETEEYARMGLLPAGAFKNREFHARFVGFDDSVDPIVRDIFFDPQTSGGLLISVDPLKAGAMLDALKRKDPGSALIGEVVSGKGEMILVE